MISRTLLLEKINKINWPSEHIEKIPHMAPEAFWDSMEHKFLEELRTIKDCVRRLYSDWNKL